MGIINDSCDESEDIEVLISAMNLSDISIIKNSNVRSSALIINQCDNEDYKEENTDYGKIRLISTVQRGLSRSRNMAIQQSRCKYCLICDDDEVLEEGYCKLINETFKKYPQAGIICFKIKFGNKKFPNKTNRINYLNSLRVSSPQMVLNMEIIKKKSVFFDERFGSGTKIGSGEENIFMYDCLKKGIEIIYVPELIAEIKPGESHWFKGYNKKYFYNRGIIIRRLMGKGIGFFYCMYFIFTKYRIYKKDSKFIIALKNILKGLNASI